MGTLYRNGIPYVGSGGAGGVEVTQAEYDALPTSEKMNGSIYFITDGSVSYPTASQMRYDNTESGIPSTSVQGAIDELKIEIGDTDISTIGDGTLSGAVSELNNGLSYTVIGSVPSISNSGTYQLTDSIENYKTLCVVVRVQNNRCGCLYIPVEDILEGGYGSTGYNYFASANYMSSSTYSVDVQLYFKSANEFAVYGYTVRGWSGDVSVKIYGL